MKVEEKVGEIDRAYDLKCTRLLLLKITEHFKSLIDADYLFLESYFGKFTIPREMNDDIRKLFERKLKEVEQEIKSL